MSRPVQLLETVHLLETLEYDSYVRTRTGINERIVKISTPDF